MNHEIERPVETERQDRLLRHDFVARLLDALIDPEGQTTGVVLGLTGPSGGGKSSVLNLVAERAEVRHPTTIVVIFNPLLADPRNGLIHAFFAELTAAIETVLERPGCPRAAELKALAQSIFRYGRRIAPAENILFCDGGAAAAGLDTLRQSLPGGATWRHMRAVLERELDASGAEILVLIDEIDRLPDREVSALAQLLGAVADFGHFSYLLAYDADRIAHALGDGDARRGRTYIEKIVQLEIPLPPVLPRQIRRILETRFAKLVEESDEHRQRLSQLLGVLVPAIIGSLRDTKRVLAGFAVLHRLLQFEIDEVDLLGWAALLAKYPDVEQVLRRRQEQIIGPANHLFGEPLLDRILIGDRPAAVELALRTGAGASEELWLEQGGERLAEGPSARPLQRLLEFLFKTPWENRKDPLISISAAVPLAKALGFGNLIRADEAGDSAPHPRYVDVIRALGEQDAAALTGALQVADSNGNLVEFLMALLGCGHRAYPRLSEGLWPLDGIWSAFSDFAERVPAMTELPREPVNRRLAKFISGPYLLRLGAFQRFLRPNLDIMREWIATGRFALAGHLLEQQMAVQWNVREQTPITPFLARNEAALVCKELAAACRAALHADTLIEGIADLACLRAVVRGTPEAWDDECRRRMDEALASPERLDRFIWYCFGEAEPEAARIAATALVADRGALRAAVIERLNEAAPMPELIRRGYQIAETKL